MKLCISSPPPSWLLTCLWALSLFLSSWIISLACSSSFVLYSTSCCSINWFALIPSPLWKNWNRPWASATHCGYNETPLKLRGTLNGTTLPSSKSWNQDIFLVQEEKGRGPKCSTCVSKCYWNEEVHCRQEAIFIQWYSDLLASLVPRLLGNEENKIVDC